MCPQAVRPLIRIPVCVSHHPAYKITVSILWDSMGLCEQCRSIAENLMPLGRSKVFHHDAASLKKATEEKCFACLRIWNSLSEEQQAIASRPDFEGIDCYSVLRQRTCAKGDEEPILAYLSFEHGEDLYCDDYNVMGGWRGSAGHFAVLNPNGTCIW